ncbi:MATE family efflux transporter [Bremerella alba]|uniref:Multidrug-efflux transporter n=1 Tax=Bremerella alba TaxID=980252 RepID=A0A7V8V4K8_9BACT|nr:MATE family efflux transporter [Bremerella alba]MBA2114850.1 Multidrug resistance protein NorM [Bremerella alba]
MAEPSQHVESTVSLSNDVSWWSRPCGIRELLLIALPLIASTASWSMTNFVDRMFLFWYSPEAMTAALPAGMLHFTLLCFPIGLASYLNTFVAQYDGAGRPDQIGVVIRKGVKLGSLMIPAYFLTIPLAAWAFSMVGHSAEVQQLEVRYFQILTFGAGASVVSAAMSTFFTGRGKTTIVMFVEIGSCVLNVVLDGLFIFGYCGEWLEGITGAAVGTSLSQWFKVVAYLILLWRPASSGQFGFLDWSNDEPGLLRRIFQYGSASGFQVLLEVGTFTGFTFLMGRMGMTAMTASTLAVDINALTFVPLIGLGIAISTLVGREIGHADPARAAVATWSGLLIAVMYAGGMGLTYLLLPDFFLSAHAMGMEPSEFEEIRALTIVLLRFVAFFCVFDAVNLVFVSALKGAGDVRFILVVGLIFSSILLVVGATCAWLDMIHVQGLWVAMTGWVILLALTHWGRFFTGQWRHKKVIDTA